jgi:hypothetical protein
MSDRERPSAEEAPELHNAEQDDESQQAQEIAREARSSAGEASPLDSERPDKGDETRDDSSPDLIDRMRDMEQSGRIDMGAYRGEPNMDDEDETYGEGHDPDED